ncbi:MAG: phosphate/phosphite/phosphonate ABC transporter substrate-binding protein [Geminicoccaceae bacterium]
MSLKAKAVQINRKGASRSALMLCCLALSFWTAYGWPAHAADAGQNVTGDTIVLGRVSNNPRKHYAALDALGAYIVKASDAFGHHETVLARDNEQLIAFLQAGMVDLVSETPFSAIVYERLAGATILLRQWKGGRSSYRTHFFTRKDSEIERLEDLVGRLMAFEDPGSTSGFFVPKATIAAQGLSLEAASHAVRDDSVRYLFAESEVNAVVWVARGKADAGAVSDINWQDSSRAPPGLKKSLRLFHTTPAVVRSVMVAGPRLSDKQMSEISAILVKMHEHDEGRATLKDFYKTTKFDKLVGEARVGLDHVRMLFDNIDLPDF